MKFHSKNTGAAYIRCDRYLLRKFGRAVIHRKERAFSLVEAATAVIILAIVSAGVVVVINRCITSAADSELRMRAFAVARENMEKLLASDVVKETTEDGTSDKYSEIKWQTVVEPFYEPITNRMWIRGVCTAEYTDTEGETQTVELTHWLTDVTKDQLLQIVANKEKQKDEVKFISQQLITTIEEAAKYANVDVQTVKQWVDNGMVTLEDGSFVKKNLDIFKESNGNPVAEDKNLQIKSEVELAELVKESKEPEEPRESEEPREPGEPRKPKETTEQKKPAEQKTPTDDWLDGRDPTTGLTYREIEQMSFQQLWELLRGRLQP